jgi:hypothetical protein
LLVDLGATQTQQDNIDLLLSGDRKEFFIQTPGRKVQVLAIRFGGYSSVVERKSISAFRFFSLNNKILSGVRYQLLLVMDDVVRFESLPRGPQKSIPV